MFHFNILGIFFSLLMGERVSVVHCQCLSNMLECHCANMWNEITSAQLIMFYTFIANYLGKVTSEGYNVKILK